MIKRRDQKPAAIARTDHHPLNRALGDARPPKPRFDRAKGETFKEVETVEWRLYMALLRRWTFYLTDEERAFVCAVVSTRGDWVTAVYAARVYQPGSQVAGRLIQESAPQGEAIRKARILYGSPDVRDAIRDFFAFYKPTRAEILMHLHGMMQTADKPTDRMAALTKIISFSPQMAVSEDASAEAEENEIKSSMRDLLIEARKRGLVDDVSGRILDGTSPALDMPLPEGLKDLGHRVDDPLALDATG